MKSLKSQKSGIGEFAGVGLLGFGFFFGFLVLFFLCVCFSPSPDYLSSRLWTSEQVVCSHEVIKLVASLCTFFAQRKVISLVLSLSKVRKKNNHPKENPKIPNKNTARNFSHESFKCTQGPVLVWFHFFEGCCHLLGVSCTLFCAVVSVCLATSSVCSVWKT